MTIEEYLRKIRELNENLSVHMDEPTQKYLAAQRDLIDELLGKLSTFNHETTLREVKEECQKHEGEGGCGSCVLLREPSSSSPYYCEVGGMPAGWGIDRIQKRVKEARK